MYRFEWLGGCVAGTGSMSMCEHGIVWHVACMECGRTPMHCPWCMGGNSAGCVHVCVFFPWWKRRKITNNPSSFLALFFIAFIIPPSFSSFFLFSISSFLRTPLAIHTPSRRYLHSRHTTSSFFPIGDLLRPCLSPWASAPVPSLALC